MKEEQKEWSEEKLSNTKTITVILQKMPKKAFNRQSVKIGFKTLCNGFLQSFWTHHYVGLYVPTLGRSCSKNVCFCGECDVVRTFTPW